MSKDGYQSRTVVGRVSGQERRGTVVSAGVSKDGCQGKSVDERVSRLEGRVTGII